MKIIDIRIRRIKLKLDPPFIGAWDPIPRDNFAASVTCVYTHEGITGYGSGDTMDGFEMYKDLFIGKDPLQISRHVRTLETLSVHASRYWPFEAALWDILGKACGKPVSVLFGARTDKIKAYASTGQLKSPKDQAEQALALREH